jgi:succinoglycan biosynthesis transport protein ExoP
MSTSGRERYRPPGGLQSPAFTRYYAVLREQYKIVAACVVIVVIATVAYVKLATPKYTATGQMLVNPVTSQDTTLFGLPVLHSSGAPTTDVLTASSLVATPAVANAVVKQLHLKITGAALLSQVSATPVGQSNLVSVQVTASSAKEAQSVANAFLRQVVATRSASLKAAIATILPGLESQVASLPATERSGPGSTGAQISELRQLQLTGDPTITPSATASLPGSPSSPKTKLSLVAGLFGGLIIGIGAAFAFHSLDPRLRRESQLREIFDVPTMARIPREHSGRVVRPILPSGMSMAAQEGYRTLRTILTSRSGGKSRSFLITGSSPSEGKTTSAIALAVSLSQTGARVILIEADVRRPTIAATLGLNPRFGTEHVLTGEAELDEALTVATFDGVPVGVLAVVQPRIELADHLSLAVAQRMIEDATKLVNYVVIDSPPLTAVIDALPLAQTANEVLVVARIGTSKLNKLDELRNLLVEQGTYPSGVILVGDSTGRGDTGYYPQGSTPGGSLPRPTARNGELEVPRTTKA